MILKAAKRDIPVGEVPIDYYPRTGESKLNTWRDGWRHLRFMLVHSSTFLFLIPGLVLFSLGLVVMLALGGGPGRPLRRPLVHPRDDRRQHGDAGRRADRPARRLRADLRGALPGRARPAARADSGRSCGWSTACSPARSSCIAGARACSERSSASGPPAASARSHEEHPALLGLTLVGLGVQILFGSFFLSVLGLRKHIRFGDAPAADRDRARRRGRGARPGARPDEPLGGHRTRDPLEVGVHHHLHQLAEARPRRPAELAPRLRRVADAAGRPRPGGGSAGRRRRACPGRGPRARTRARRTPAPSASRRSRPRSRRARPAGASATSPRRSRRRSPSRAWRRGCPSRSSSVEPELDARHPVGDLARHELEPAPRRLVVEEDPGDGEQAVRLAVVDRDVVPVHLGDAVGRARVERRQLGLRRPRAPCRTSPTRTPGRSGSPGRPSGSPRASASRRGRELARSAPAGSTTSGRSSAPRGCRPRPAAPRAAPRRARPGRAGRPGRA